MKCDKLEIVSYASIAIIVTSLFFIGIGITGYAVTDNETALVNVTITASGALNFTTAILDFGTGAVTPGQSYAVIDSEGTVTDGDWTPVTGELVLENIGNVNVSLTLSTNKTIEDFIGGGTSRDFKAKVANSTGNAGACSGSTFDDYAQINETLQVACPILAFEEEHDEIDLDFEITIPNDAFGTKSVGIVAIGTY
jgi:hypothetical protein